MINITRSEINTVVVTLTEKTTIDITVGDAGYIFVFISPSTNKEVVFTAADVSTAKTRFNQFLIEEVESVDEDLTIGKVYLLPGTYHYVIYETTDTTALTYTGLGIVETGIVKVYDDTAAKATYNPVVLEKPAYDPEH